MQTKDIFRTKAFRFVDRCTVSLLVFTLAAFSVYIIGSCQAFLPSTMMMLLHTTTIASLALIGCSIFSSVITFFYIPRRRNFAFMKLGMNFFFIILALIFLYASSFIIACV